MVFFSKYGQRTTDNGQRTTDNGQRTTDNGQRTTDNGQREAWLVDAIAGLEKVLADRKLLCDSAIKRIVLEYQVELNALRKSPIPREAG